MQPRQLLEVEKDNNSNNFQQNPQDKQLKKNQELSGRKIKVLVDGQEVYVDEATAEALKGSKRGLLLG